MSFLQKREPEPDYRGIHRLPKQQMPPGLKQLQVMLEDCNQVAGRTCQLPFGEPPEEYSLAVFRDRIKTEVHWALYRGEGNSALLIWDQAADDPGFIHQLIAAQFPGLDIKPAPLRPNTDLVLPNQGLLESQNQTVTRPDLREQQATTLHLRGKPTFEGDLKDLALPNVLQSIAMSKATGRLELEKQTETATIFISDGAPIHSLSRGHEGEASFIELIGWDEGEFRFYPGIKHDQRTIKRRLDTLLMEGSAVEDQFQALKKMGAHDDAYPIRKMQSLSEQNFDFALQQGMGVDTVLSKRIYLVIDGRTTLIDMMRRLGLSKPQWVPIVLQLASCNLIGFQDQIPTALAQSDVKIDWAQAVNTEHSLARADTGIYSHSAFLFFLKRELWRWERFGRPFSVVILQLSGAPVDSPGASEPLSIPEVREIGERVLKLKSKTDIFAHYETFGFALLMRETDATSANAFADRLVAAICNEPLRDGMSGVVAIARAGVACIPDDCSTLGAMLARAKPRSMTEALSEARDRVRAVIDNALDVICSTDEALRLVEVNPACETALDRQPEELLGMRFTSLLVAADVQPSLEKIRELMSAPIGSKRVYLENRLLKADGSYVHFQWSMRWSSEKKMLFLVGRDISAQKELERLKTELIRTITHDLRSPAMAVDGFLEAIEDEIAEPAGRNWAPMHKAAQVASSRMIKLISDLLAYEKISDAMVVLDYQPVQVNEIFSQSVASVAAPQVTIEAIPNDLSLQCDQDRVVQIVVNLLANAVKFSPPGSTITLAAAQTENQVGISITDRGAGIPQEYLDSIFLPFKQVENQSGGRPKGGFGLGLAIAKAFAELHGGNIIVQSEIGKGSTFCVWLPKTRPVKT